MTEPVQWPLEPGRAIAIPVHPRDVLPWTNQHCKACVGRGVITTLKLSEPRKVFEKKRENGTRERTIDPAKYQRKTTICGCALKRFRAKQMCHVEKGRLYAVEPWVAISPETMREVVETMEKEQEAKEAEQLPALEVPSESPGNT